MPSGTRNDWGNRDYDVNLAISDKAWDANGQLYFNIFSRDGFLGDRITVNMAWMPYMEVRPRRYRFRIFNASMARLYKIAIVTAAGKRMPYPHDRQRRQHHGTCGRRSPIPKSQDLPLQAIGERFDIIVDFSTFAKGTKLYFVNLAEHEDGSRAKQIANLGDALRGRVEGSRRWQVPRVPRCRRRARRPGLEHEPGRLCRGQAQDDRPANVHA